MTPTKCYAIRCSTEEQARECNIKKLKSWISPDIINFYRNKWYTIISYSEAKGLGLLGEHYQDTINIVSIDSEKETTDELIDKIISDMWERPFATTWEKEERNMRKILRKHLQSLQEPTEEIKYEWDYKKSMWIVD